MSTTRFGRLAVVAIMGGTALVAVPTVVSAQETSGDRDVQTIVDALVASGVPEDVIDEELEQRLRKAVDELVDAEVIEPEDIDDLRDEVDAGEAEAAITRRLHRGRQRQADYRDAVEKVLIDQGIELEDGQSARDALQDKGLSNDVIKDLLPKRRDVRCQVEGDCKKPKDSEDNSDEAEDRSHTSKDERKAEKERVKDAERSIKRSKKDRVDAEDDDVDHDRDSRDDEGREADDDDGEKDLDDDMKDLDRDHESDAEHDNDRPENTTTTAGPNTTAGSDTTAYRQAEPSVDDSTNRAADIGEPGGYDA